MARKTRTGLVAARAPVTTTPFDVDAFIRAKDQEIPGFAAAVDAELANLRLEDRLRSIRKEQHLTQAQLAKRMGMSQSAITQIEKAEPGRMEIRTLAKMATAMGYALHIDFKPKPAVTLPEGSTVVFKKGKPIEVHAPDGTISVSKEGRSRRSKATRRPGGAGHGRQSRIDKDLKKAAKRIRATR